MNWAHSVIRTVALIVAVVLYVGWGFRDSTGLASAAELTAVAAVLAIALVPDTALRSPTARGLWVAVVATGALASAVSLWNDWTHGQTPDLPALIGHGLGLMVLLLGSARLRGQKRWAPSRIWPVVVGAGTILGVTCFGTSYWCARESLDETITSGSKWGVVIGESKEQTLSRVRAEYDPRKVHVAIPYEDEADPGPRYEFTGPLSEAPINWLLARDEWFLYWMEEGTDLTLEFADGTLASAQMLRRPCEL